MSRIPRAFRPYVLLVALVAIPALALIGAAAGGFLGNLRAPGLPQNAIVEGEALIGGPFSLIDQNGARRSDADFRGRFMLVFFGYTYCPDVCPTTLAILSAALDQLGPISQRVVPILITVDPARDTPEILKPYLSAFGPQFVGLTGTDEEIAAAAGAYRVYYKSNAADGPDYTVDHSSVIYVMGPDGAFITNYGLDDGPDAIADDLRRRLSDAS